MNFIAIAIAASYRAITHHINAANFNVWAFVGAFSAICLVALIIFLLWLYFYVWREPKREIWELDTSAAPGLELPLHELTRTTPARRVSSAHDIEAARHMQDLLNSPSALIASHPLPPSVVINSPAEVEERQVALNMTNIAVNEQEAKDEGEVEVDEDVTARRLFEEGEGKQSSSQQSHPATEPDLTREEREPEAVIEPAHQEEIRQFEKPSQPSSSSIKAPPSRIPRSPLPSPLPPSPPPPATTFESPLLSPSYDDKAGSESPQLTMPPRALIMTPSPSTRLRHEVSSGGKSIASSGGSAGGDRPPWKIPGKAPSDLFGSTLPVGGSGRWRKDEEGRWSPGGSRRVSQAGKDSSEGGASGEKPQWKRPGTGGGAL